MIRNMKITNKLLLVAMGFLIPIALLFQLLISEKDIAIEFAEKELIGTQFLVPLYTISSYTPIHYLIADNILLEHSPSKTKLSEIQQIIDKNLNQIKKLGEALPNPGLTFGRMNSFENRWKKLKVSTEKGTHASLLNLHETFRYDIDNIINHIGDESNLKLDPDLDSYYLMISVLENIPDQSDRIYETLKLMNLANNSDKLIESGTLEVKRSELVNGIRELRTSFEAMYSKNSDGVIKSTLDIHLVEQEVLCENFISMIDSFPQLDNWFEKNKIIEYGIEVAESNYRFWKLSNNTLQNLLQARIAGFNEKKLITLSLVSFVIFMTLALFLFIMRNITRSVKTLDNAANSVIKGALNVEVPIRSKDELGNLGTNFNKMIKFIGRNIREKTEKLVETEHALHDERIKHNQAEEALSKSEMLFSKVWGISADGMRLTNAEGKIVTVNDAYCKIVGLTKSELEGSNFSIVYKEENRHTFQAMYAADLKHNKIKPHFERESALWNGKKLWFSFSNSYLRLSNGVLVLSIIKDITERKKAEFELKESTTQLRNLASHLQSVREEERRMIAREIHDELGQVLTVLKIQISLLSNKLRKDQTEIKEKIYAVSEVIDQTVETVQRITSKLRPGILDDLGLIPAIEWQAQDFESKTGIICDCELPPDDIELDQEKVTAVFRIFQEALTNVARHANANTVRVRVKTEGEVLMVRITDNGRGITEKEIADSNSLGLLGMKERAMLFNGEVKVSGEPNKGTSVSVSIPLNKLITVEEND